VKQPHSRLFEVTHGILSRGSISKWQRESPIEVLWSRWSRFLFQVCAFAGFRVLSAVDRSWSLHVGVGWWIAEVILAVVLASIFPASYGGAAFSVGRPDLGQAAWHDASLKSVSRAPWLPCIDLAPAERGVWLASTEVVEVPVWTEAAIGCAVEVEFADFNADQGDPDDRRQDSADGGAAKGR
jgi:hypothetical protein